MENKLFNSLGNYDKIAVRKSYKLLKEDAKTGDLARTKMKQMEDLYGKENLERRDGGCWSDLVKTNPELDSQLNTLKEELDKMNLDARVRDKILATFKISKVIDSFYGGQITDDEWDNDTYKYAVEFDTNVNELYDETEVCASKYFIAFRTKEERENFLSYRENESDAEDYFMKPLNL